MWWWLFRVSETRPTREFSRQAKVLDCVTLHRTTTFYLVRAAANEDEAVAPHAHDIRRDRAKGAHRTLTMGISGLLPLLKDIQVGPLFVPG